MRLYPFVLSSVALSTALFLAGGARASVASDTTDPEHLIAAYHAAVVGHDGDRLASLFVPEGSAWFSVLSDEGFARLKGLKPDTVKLRPGACGTS